MSFNISATPSTTATVSITGGVAFQVPGTSQTIISGGTTKAGTAVVAGTGVSMYTVTAGKTFYLTHLHMGGNNVFVEIRDNGLAGTLKGAFTLGAGTGNGVDIIFTTPISFTTDLFMDVAVNQTLRWQYSGYEV